MVGKKAEPDKANRFRYAARIFRILREEMP